MSETHGHAAPGDLAGQVRAADPDRYFSSLFAPTECRNDLFALYAFDAEIAAIRGRISEPMPGEIRLQWWRDELDAIFAARARGIPIADGLVSAVAAHALPRASFEACLDARVFDLYDDPMPSLNDLEGYFGETEAAVLQLAAIVLAGADGASASDVSGHAGIAIGVARILARLASEPWRVAFLPRDLCAEHGAGEGEGAGLGPDTVMAIRAALAAHGLDHADRAAAAFSALPADRRSRLLPVYLPLGPARLDLRRLTTTRPDVTSANLWRRMLSIYWTARRGRL